MTKKRMIMFAVIAAIIVAAPISFLSLVRSSESFSVVDGNVYHIYPANLSNLDIKRQNLIFHSSSIAYQGNQTEQSYFNASTTFSGCYMMTQSVGDCLYNSTYVYVMFFNYNFQGDFYSNLHPTKVVVSASAYYQNHSLDQNVLIENPWFNQFLQDRYDRNVSNTSGKQAIDFSSASVDYPLENNSFSKNDQRYYFCLANQSECFPREFQVIYNVPLVYNLTIDITFDAVSSSAMLVDNFTIYVIDTGIRGD